MTDALESELDRLFQLAPADMVEARNALADALRKAGDKAAAARVKALKRPTPTAWALNQVHFREPALLARARENTARFRELQARDGVQRDELTAASLAQRGAVQQVIDAAMRACAAAGLSSGAPQERKLLTTLQAWLAGTSEAAPGRLIQDIEPTGFEAIASVGRVAPTPALPTPPPPPPPTAAKPDPKRIALAEAQVRASEEAAERAQAHAAELDKRRAQAQSTFDHAHTALREAEEAITRLRRERESAARELEEVRQAAERAASDYQRAQAAVSHARDELAIVHRTNKT